MLDEISKAMGLSPVEDMLGKEKFNCEKCEDKGFYEKTEWSGEDDSYDITVRCACNED